jgi:hypothetical protein
MPLHPMKPQTFLTPLNPSQTPLLWTPGSKPPRNTSIPLRTTNYKNRSPSRGRDLELCPKMCNYITVSEVISCDYLSCTAYEFIHLILNFLFYIKRFEYYSSRTSCSASEQQCVLFERDWHLFDQWHMAHGGIFQCVYVSRSNLYRQNRLVYPWA